MDYLSTLGDSLSQTMGGILPGILGAIAVLIIGLILASVVSRLVKGAFRKTNIDERLASKMDLNFNLGDFIGKIVHYLLVLFVLLLVLEMMGLTSVLDPLRDMLGKFFGAIPNLIYAGIIGFIGYVIAKIASETVGLISTPVESFSAKIGFENPDSLVKVLKQVVFIFIFLPMLIMALDALKMDAISRPISDMFSKMLAAIPNIIAAAIIIGVFYFVGRFLVGFLTELLRNLGVDSFPDKLGFASVLNNASLSAIIGNVVFFFLMFAGVISAMEKLEMTAITDILNNVMNIAGRVFFGLIILVAGSFIANLASKAMASSDAWLASLVKFAVLGIFLAFALHTMGIAQSIVNMAFGFILGAVAVAFALSFGLGGREAAGKQVQQFFDKMNKK